MNTKSKTNEITLMHQNIQGYGGKKEEVQKFLKQANVDIVCLTEHWQSDEQNFEIKNYKVGSSFCRDPKRRGGSAILVKSSLAGHLEYTNSTKIEKMSKESIIELSCVELKDQIVICVYTPYTKVYRDFEPVMRDVLKVATKSGKSVKVCGDFNVDLLRPSTTRSKILKLFGESGLQHIYEEPTHFTRSAATCLDNVFTNSPYKKKFVTNYLKSDHSGQVVTFADTGDVFDVNNNDVNLRTQIPCRRCDLNFNSNAGYQSHMRAHARVDKDKVATNKYSDSKPTVASAGQKHIDKNGILTCETCEHTFETKPGYLSHMRAHERAKEESTSKSIVQISNDKEEILTCRQCDRTFETNPGYLSHMRAHERAKEESTSTSLVQISKDKEEILTCRQCDRTFESNPGYLSHMRAHERAKEESISTSAVQISKDKEEILTCRQCDRTFETKPGYLSHMRAHERAKEESISTSAVQISKDKEEILTCRQCDRTFETKPGYLSHMRAHERAKEEAISTSAVQISKDKEEILTCRKCDRTFDTKPGYLSHMRSHERSRGTEGNINVSSNSGQASTSGSTSNTRNDNGDLTCSQCYRKFETKLGYLSHMRAHARHQADDSPAFAQHVANTYSAYVSPPNVREYSYDAGLSCAQCGRTFESKAGYSSHMRAHARQQDQESQLAARNNYQQIFSGYSSYASTSRTSTSREYNYDDGELTCPQCYSTFVSKPGYLSHMRAHARS